MFHFLHKQHVPFSQHVSYRQHVLFSMCRIATMMTPLDVLDDNNGDETLKFGPSGPSSQLVAVTAKTLEVKEHFSNISQENTGEHNPLTEELRLHLLDTMPPHSNSDPFPTMTTKRNHKQLTPYEKASIDVTRDARMVREVMLGKRIGFYRIWTELGRGNFSRVMLATHMLTKGKIKIHGHLLLLCTDALTMYSIYVTQHYSCFIYETINSTALFLFYI